MLLLKPILLVCLIRDVSSSFCCPPPAQAISLTRALSHTFYRSCPSSPFLPRVGTKASSRQDRIRGLSQFRSSKSDDQVYSDDCFGLIFVTSSIALQDAVFAATFLTFSTVASVLSRQKMLPESLHATTKAPAGVAAVTILATPIARILVDFAGLELPGINASSEVIPNASFIEVGLCSFSIAYGLLRAKD